MYEDVLREFQNENVKYILVGGMALNLLGSMRGTIDLDILVHMSSENLKKIVLILSSLGYGVKQPIDPLKIADDGIRKDWIDNKHMKAFNFFKDSDLKEVDIIIDSPISYADAIKDPVNIKIGDLTIPVISIDNLIEMKQFSGREIDKVDIGDLIRLKELKGGD